ncbi:UNVERIFIED_CONTAM: hypothetical protein NCL1_62923 [Trichonephila clavipes]
MIRINIITIRLKVRSVSIETESLKYNYMGLIWKQIPFIPIDYYPLKSKTNSCIHIIPAPNNKLKDKFNKEPSY